MEYLVFQLYGPLASWGEPATGEVRRSSGHPGRSAIIGLLAAALGITRDDESQLAALRDGVIVAVKQLSPGVMIQDYHTAQVPGQDRKAWRMTRRDELSARSDRLHTILSTREYRCDGYWQVAVRTAAGCPWTLEAMVNALRRPRFPLYLGRKSCPPAAPLAPRVVEAGGVRGAFAREFDAFTTLGRDDERRLLRMSGEVAYAWEGDGGDLAPQETRHPQDQPLNRERWQFTSRPEHWHTTTEGA
ncbi:type I-E CRISPR-associated protein Cas5/CasD [Arhodomonas aquaeolei]|uniref:type I-E CRISPR-associated protein Cas5/CasD n=1 Tax=Arhodomonas aquaeolei TaxID=2369 RepID=UPI00037A1C43|nr:type I-E CRISPR-associated protein Cas5/CasD [Arhodomonas aquaeolei]